jgi:hypothetical protein
MAKKLEAVNITVKKLEIWLREQLFRVLEEDDKARFHRVVVRQIVRGNKQGEEAFVVEVPKKAKEEWCSSAALDLFTRLQAEAPVLSGYQKYALYAFFNHDTANHVSRHLIGIQGSDEEEEGYETEGPDREGLLRGAQRHLEVAMKINAGQNMTVTQSQASLIGKLTTMLETSLEKQAASLDMLAELIEQRQQHEINAIKERTKAQAMEGIAKRVQDIIIPAIGNRITGADQTAVKRDALMLMTKGVLTAIASDETRMGKLMAMLSPEEQIGFMNLLETLSAKTNPDGSPVPNGVNSDPTEVKEEN